MQTLMSVCIVSLLVMWYVWPALLKLSRNDAFIPLLWVHVFRYVGMTILVKGMIDPKIPEEFLSHGAYGDLLAAGLALVSIFALRGNWRLAIPLVWVANVFGIADLLNGLRGILSFNFPVFNLDTI